MLQYRSLKEIIDQGGLSQAGRSVKENVRQRLLQFLAAVDQDAQPLDDRFLADHFAQPARPQGVVAATFLFRGFTAPYNRFTRHWLSFTR